jgi:hypothetical protein
MRNGLVAGDAGRVIFEAVILNFIAGLFKVEAGS